MVPTVYSAEKLSLNELSKSAKSVITAAQSGTINPDLLKGIVAIRELHMRAIRETGFTCADELLYPEDYRYLDDVLGYAAVLLTAAVLLFLRQMKKQ